MMKEANDIIDDNAYLEFGNSRMAPLEAQQTLETAES